MGSRPHQGSGRTDQQRWKWLRRGYGAQVVTMVGKTWRRITSGKAWFQTCPGALMRRYLRLYSLAETGAAAACAQNCWEVGLCMRPLPHKMLRAFPTHAYALAPSHMRPPPTLVRAHARCTLTRAPRPTHTCARGRPRTHAHTSSLALCRLSPSRWRYQGKDRGPAGTRACPVLLLYIIIEE